MSLFSFGGKKDRFGIIIDVGSGSVLTAIVHSNKAKKYPIIIWAHREHIALKKINDVDQSAKAVMSALMSASIKLDSEGRKKLSEYAPSAKLTVVQCSIAAPWSYTVTKTVSLKNDESIEISEHFIEELIYTAQQQVEEDLRKHSDKLNISLEIIAKATMDLLSNGYRVKQPEGELAKAISLTHATVVAQKYIMDGLTEVQQKLFTSSSLNSVSFILMLYCTVRSIEPHTDDVCLIDITDEASEIGIIRDGSLKYSTHMPYGMFTLAREISEAAKVPLSEALGHMRAKDIAGLKERLPVSSHDKLTLIFDRYIEELADLLNETGDSLSIPKKVYLHIESSFEPLFTHLAERATRSATKIDHVVSSVAKELLPKDQKDEIAKHVGDYVHDTALLLNAEFFHTKKHCLDFNYS